MILLFIQEEIMNILMTDLASLLFYFLSIYPSPQKDKNPANLEID